MKELLLVAMSALLGYIVFSAFSSSDTPKEAFKKIMEQPQKNFQANNDMANTRLYTQHEETLIALENKHKIEQLELYGKLEMHNKENATQIELQKLNNELDQKLALLKLDAQDKGQSKNNATLIIIMLFFFILLFIYLKHQKHLREIELEKQEKYDEMLLKKEYAEKIIAYMSQGNLTFETERKLLNILDELNGKSIHPVNQNELYHPNPDIIQLENR